MKEGCEMYIYSKWSDKDLLKLNKTNSVGDLYELLGIYVSFCNERARCSFKKYYEAHVNMRPYHYRNIGEKQVKNILQEKNVVVSRKEIRLLSRTYYNIPVITSDKMGIIFSELTNEIYKCKKTERILSTLPKKFTPQDFLYFQYYFIIKYVCSTGYANSYKKKDIFRQVKEEWENNRIFIS